MMPGVTLDAGALIALDRNDRRVVVLLARASETGARITVPATALAQAVRRPDQQVRRLGDIGRDARVGEAISIGDFR